MTFVGYVRVSEVGDRNEDQFHSPRFQEEQIKSYAASNGIEVEMLPAELDASGGHENREILQEALRGIEEGKWEGLIVAKFDRLSRSLTGATKLLERIENSGGSVKSASENIDPETSEGEFTRNLFFSVARMQHRQLSDGFAKARKDAVERGIHVSKAPFGYMKGEDKRLIPDSDTAPLVKKAFEMRSQGISWRAIADVFEETLGRPYLPQSISRMITNDVYIGTAKSGEYVKENAHPALIDKALFLAAQLDHPRPPRNGEKALLSGCVYCESCGHKLSVTSWNDGRIGYKCRIHFEHGKCQEPARAGKWLTRYVEELLLKVMEDRQYKATQNNEELEQASKAYDEAQAEIAAFVEHMSARDPGFAAGIKKRQEELRKAEERLGKVRAGITVTPGTKNFKELWSEFNSEQKNQLIRQNFRIFVRQGSGADIERVRIETDFPN